jgi:hypothetical protein
MNALVPLVRDNTRAMQPDLMDWLDRLPPEAWLVPPVLVIGAVVAGILIRDSVRCGHYRAIAARTGLSVQRGLVNPSQVHGVFEGRQLVMTIASPRRTTWFHRNATRVAVDVQNTGLAHMRIHRKDMFDRILRIGGDVQTDDTEFDRRYVIRTLDRGAVIRIFCDPALRERMLRVNVESVETASKAVWVFYHREMRDPEHAEQFFTAAVHLAKAIDGTKYP